MRLFQCYVSAGLRRCGDVEETLQHSLWTDNIETTSLQRSFNVINVEATLTRRHFNVLCLLDYNVETTLLQHCVLAGSALVSPAKDSLL